MNIPVLAVAYLETEAHYNMAQRAVDAFLEQGLEVTIVINKWLDGFDLFDESLSYNDTQIRYIDNDRNCLARGWNKGLEVLFQVHDYVIVSGLDSECPNEEQLEEMLNYLKEHDCGMVSATASGIYPDAVEWTEMLHGDGSFSLFIISKDAYYKTPQVDSSDYGFDERYEPAYFEDNNYLERLWLAGYKPMRSTNAMYYHVTQGTVKYGNEIRKDYPTFMQKNLELFKSQFGKVPEHLPQDIKFS